MITVTCDTVTSSGSLLRLGCVVRGPDDAWVRFAVLEVDVNLFTPEVVSRLERARDSDSVYEPEDPALF